VIALLLIPVLSLGRAVFTPNNLSMSERAAEWMRDNHLGGVLNQIESWWFSNHQPKAGGEPTHTIDTSNAAATETTAAGAKVAPHLPKPANVNVPDGVTPLANEGAWSPVGPLVGNAQSMYTTQVRPDSVHTSILDGLVWMDPKLVRFEVHPGTQEPGGKSAIPTQVPVADRLDLVAAFNGGFRMQDARGGFYLDGVTHKPLRDGAASLVVYKDGVATVGMWGRDVEMGPNVLAVRQNLDLVIDNGGGFPFPGGNPPMVSTTTRMARGETPSATRCWCGARRSASPPTARSSTATAAAWAPDPSPTSCCERDACGPWNSISTRRGRHSTSTSRTRPETRRR
jgi:hypothetical protein